MVLSVILIFTLIGLVVQNRRVTSLEVRLLRLTRGSDDGTLEDVLESHLDSVARVVDDVDELAVRTAGLETRSQRAFQRIGFVRFNPFEDTGGNQSFALALLDGSDDGIVISSLHTRAATRMYAKTVSGGRSDGAMSDEETQALELARSAPTGRIAESVVDVTAAVAAPARESREAMGARAGMSGVSTPAGAAATAGMWGAAAPGASRTAPGPTGGTSQR